MIVTFEAVLVLPSQSHAPCGAAMKSHWSGGQPNLKLLQRVRDARRGDTGALCEEAGGAHGWPLAWCTPPCLTQHMQVAQAGTRWKRLTPQCKHTARSFQSTCM